MFVEVDGLIKGYNETKYSVLSGPEKYDAIFNRIRYPIGIKIDITYIGFHNYEKSK